MIAIQLYMKLGQAVIHVLCPNICFIEKSFSFENFTVVDMNDHWTELLTVCCFADVLSVYFSFLSYPPTPIYTEHFYWSVRVYWSGCPHAHVLWLCKSWPIWACNFCLSWPALLGSLNRRILFDWLKMLFHSRLLLYSDWPHMYISNEPDILYHIQSHIHAQ